MSIRFYMTYIIIFPCKLHKELALENLNAAIISLLAYRSFTGFT